MTPPPAATPVDASVLSPGVSILDAVGSWFAWLGGLLIDPIPGGGLTMVAQAIWLCTVLVVSYRLAVRGFRQPVPDLLRWLVRPAWGLIALIRYLLLLLDLGIARLLGRLQRKPAYSCGQLVDDLTGAARRTASALLHRLAVTCARFPRGLAILLIAVTPFVWDHRHCAGTPSPDRGPTAAATCTHPIEHWFDRL